LNVHVLAGSEWQYKQARISTLFKNKQVHKILIPIDPDIFKPVEKAKLRMNLKIGEGKRIIFFGAVGLTEKRKGMHLLFESLGKLKELIRNDGSQLENEILLLIAGGGYQEIVDLLPFESHYLGYLDNNYGIASAYQAADIFLCPSIEDSGPMMINQSIMSGTPVVSFEMGVSLDLVINGETGYRAKLKDSSDMATGILKILKLNSDDYSKMSINCRNLALKLCSPETRMGVLGNLLKEEDSN
jgi:glycosyltransferase involved in cell wall biosynthesis